MFVNNPNELDQHFLIDKDIINSFINICNLSEDDIVLEIGPGIGTLTKLIAPKVKKLYVIEKDIRLKPYLDKIDNIQVMYDSCLNVNFPKVDKIITSLPYSIIEPFIYKIINEDFKELYMIMGKKYCDNVLGNKITNLSLLTNIYFKITKYFDIMPDSFNPKPRVVSSIIKLEILANLMLLNTGTLFPVILWLFPSNLPMKYPSIIVPLSAWIPERSRSLSNTKFPI